MDDLQVVNNPGGDSCEILYYHDWRIFEKIDHSNYEIMVLSEINKLAVSLPWAVNSSYHAVV